MYCVIKCIVRGNQACVKNADSRHPSCTVLMYRRKSAPPVHNVLSFYSCSLLSDCSQQKTLHTEYLIRKLHWDAAAVEIRKNQTVIR